MESIHQAWLVTLLLVGCTPTIPDGVYSCRIDLDCPPGLTCDGVVCRRATGIDGGADVPGLDAPRPDVPGQDAPDVFVPPDVPPPDVPIDVGMGCSSLDCPPDGNPCTLEIDCGSGCMSMPFADGEMCDDGQNCTTGDRCVAGECRSTGTTVCDDTDMSDCQIDEGRERCFSDGSCIVTRFTNGEECNGPMRRCNADAVCVITNNCCGDASTPCCSGLGPDVVACNAVAACAAAGCCP